MDMSIFNDKETKPDEEALKKAIPDYYDLWVELKTHITKTYPEVTEEWNYPGKKYGWSFRMRSKKRVVMYFLPRDNEFKIALVYGQKATDAALESAIPAEYKNIINEAKVYAEGRGFRIDIKSWEQIEDIKELIRFKMEN